MTDHDRKSLDPAEIFPAEQRYEDDWPIGSTQDHLADAIQIWFHSNGQWGDGTPLTIGKAAAAFALPPAFVAKAIDERDDPFFFAHKADRPEERLLDCHGM
jgi:hypothetical protein